MEACLSLAARLEAGFSPSSHGEDNLSLWQAACCWDQALQKLEPFQDQRDLIRLAARLASRLAQIVSESGTEVASSAACLPLASRQSNSTADAAATAAKAAQGLATLLEKHTSSADPDVVQRIAEGAAATLLGCCTLYTVFMEPRQLAAVADLAARLLGLLLDSDRCPPAGHAALARALGKPGLLTGLLRSATQCLKAAAAGQGDECKQALRRHAASVAVRLRPDCDQTADSLASEFDRLVSDEDLVQELLRQVVLPVLAHTLELRLPTESLQTWTDDIGGLIGLLLAARPHARMLMAENALALGLAVPRAARTAEGSQEAGAAVKVGGTLMLLFASALADVQAAWKKASEPRMTRRGHDEEQQRPGPSASQVAAAPVGQMAVQLTFLMRLLPCTMDPEQVQMRQEQHKQGNGTSNRTSSGANSTGCGSAVAPDQLAMRAAELGFFLGTVAVASALHAVVDSGRVLQLAFGVDDLSPDVQSALEATSAGAGAGLLAAVTGFRWWTAGTALAGQALPGDSWMPAGAAVTCAAAEALIRLAPKLQQDAADLNMGPDAPSAPRSFLFTAHSWILGLEHRLPSRGSVEQRQAASHDQEAAPPPVTVSEARAAMVPALNAAFSAVKLANAARNMPAPQIKVIFGSSADAVELSGLLVQTAMVVAQYLVSKACAGSSWKQEDYSKLHALQAAVTKLAALHASGAATLLCGSGGVACEDPGELIRVPLNLASSVMSYMPPSSPARMVLGSTTMETALRMLLAQMDASEEHLDSYRFWAFVGTWFAETPRLCGMVASTGVLSEGALWLARQLEQERLAPESASTLVGYFQALFRHAVTVLEQLASGGWRQGWLVATGVAGRMKELRAASEAALGAGQGMLMTPGFWRGLAAPRGLASLLKQLATRIVNHLDHDATAAQEEEMARLQLERICASLPCANLACTNMCGASEAELRIGRTCSACKMVNYCGVECQRASWAWHKKVCRKISQRVQAAVGSFS